MEKIEVEAGAEEVFEFWSDLKNVCALVQMTEETRRVDLSESLWSFWGPSGRRAEFGPDEFGGCLRHVRSAEGPREEMAGPSSPDLVLGDVSIDFKALSERKTLLFVTYHYADSIAGRLADPLTRSSGEPAAGAAETWGEARRYVNLHLHALVEELLAASWHERGKALLDDLARPSVAREASLDPVGDSPGDGMTEEDRAWLETDLSRLDEYDPYELTEEQLLDEEPIRYVPGLGLVVDEGDEASGAPPRPETGPDRDN